MSMEAAGLALMAVYPVLLAGIANLVGKMVPQPYMDEIFHIPQAQAYCAGIVLYCTVICFQARLHGDIFQVTSLSGIPK